MRRRWLIIPVFLAIACGDDSSRAPVASPDGMGSGGSAGRPNGASGGSNPGASGEGGAAGSGGDGGQQGGQAGEAVGGAPEFGALEVEISEPVHEQVVIAEGTGLEPLDVRCSVSDPSEVGVQSVVLELLNFDDDDSVVRTEPNPDRQAGDYVAQFALASVVDADDQEVNRVTVRCRATDREQAISQDTALVYFDRGPLIEVPERANVARPSEPLEFEFKVRPLELLPGDDADSQVEDVTLIADRVPVRQLEQNGEFWVGRVDFSDRTLYPQTPTGAIRFLIEATNRRGARRQLTYDLTLDGRGPVVEIESPLADTIIGKQQDIKFTVTDDLSGVDEATLRVKVGPRAFPFNLNDPRWTKHIEKGSYTFRIDSSEAGDVLSQMLINVEASDLAGNASATAPIPLYLDFQAPIVSLDPPNMRVVEARSDGSLDCSDSFDPLGPAAVNDLARVRDHARIRVLAWDRTNSAPGQVDYFYSGVENVELFYQRDLSKPLVVDTDRDAGAATPGACDDVAPDALPIGRLAAIAPQGDYVPFDEEKETVEPSVAAFDCRRPVKDPKPLCGAYSDMNFVPRFPMPSTQDVVPVVYGFDVKSGGSDPLCTGNTLEIRALFQNEGWICMTARSVDGVGNRAVSAPLRVCYTKDPSKDPCKDIPPPNCTDGCTTDRETNTIVRYRVP